MGFEECGCRVGARKSTYTAMGYEDGRFEAGVLVCGVVCFWEGWLLWIWEEGLVSDVVKR